MFKLIPSKYMDYDKHIAKQVAKASSDIRMEALPSAMDLACSPTVNQGSAGSCTGFGIVACVHSNIINKTGKIDNLSEQFAYLNNKKYDPWAGDDYSGSSVVTAANLSVTNGICHESLYPYQALEKGSLTSAMYKDASKRKIKAIEYASHTKQSLMSLVAAGFPLCIGVEVTSGFNNTYQNGYIHSQKGLPSQGGHCVAIVGYKTENGKVWMKIKNSWGNSWGVNGYGWYDADDLVHNLSVAIAIKEIQDDYKIGNQEPEKKLVQKCGRLWYAPWKKTCWYVEV